MAAKTLTTLDHLCDGRLDIGVGAGWYEPDYQALGMDLPSPRERLARLEEALTVLDALLPGGPATFEGPATTGSGAASERRPPARQTPPPATVRRRKGRPPPSSWWLARADGWNTCWVWTPGCVPRSGWRCWNGPARTVGRDPASVRRSLGLYTLVGGARADLERPASSGYSRLAPGGMLAGMSLEQ